MKNIYKNIFLRPFLIVFWIFFSCNGFAQKSDEDLSQSLVDKIKKGGGDIVMRPSDLKETPTSKTVSKPAAQSPTVSSTVKTKGVDKDSISHHHWSYESGETGPENWGKLSKENTVCTNGKQQSPINIEKGIQVDLPALTFDYKPSQLAIEDNGHTVMIKYGEGSNLSVQGKQYRLVQFHFHHPSEEMIDGKRFDMVAHLVHQHFDGSLLVLAVFMNANKNSEIVSANHNEEGHQSKGSLQKVNQGLTSPVSSSENPLFQQILNNIPLVRNITETPSGVMIDINHLLPKSLTYYTYMGSLTTPPCTENVTWIVLKEPIMLSQQQVENFGLIYSNNARPIQPKNDRLIKVAR
jgi:carbonic anhydrase